MEELFLKCNSAYVSEYRSDTQVYEGKNIALYSIFLYH